MDTLVRAITADGLVQAVAVTTRSLTEQARNIHKTLPVGTAALGRALAAASMMGNALWGPCWPSPTPAGTCGATCRTPTRTSPSGRTGS